jgi:non-specific serine/threonine protein kinase
MERASALSRDFKLTSLNAPSIAQICQRLDGIPLAIELAAARANMLTVEQISKRLDDRFSLLTGGSRSALPRHQTLRATIDWSYDLLADKERMLFKRLAVFADGWTLEAAEEVCSGNGIESSDILDLLSQLVNKSLVLAGTAKGEARYHILETIRQYAHEKLLEAGDVEAIRDKHLGYFVKLAAQARPQLHSAGQLAWLDRLEEEYGNIRIALNWAQESGAIAEGLRLVTDLQSFWLWRVHLQEPSLALENLLARPLSADQIQTFARGHRVAGTLQLNLGNKISAVAHAYDDERLCLLRGLEGNTDLVLARLRLNFFTRGTFMRERIQVHQMFDEGVKLLEETSDQWETASWIHGMGLEFMNSGDFIGARQAFERSLRLFRECGDMIGTSSPNMSMAHLSLEEGNYTEARAQLEENLHFLRQARVNIYIDGSLWLLGVTAMRERDYARAKERYTECLLFGRQIGLRRQLAECLIGFAGIASAEKRFERAAHLLGAGESELEARVDRLENIDQIELKRLTRVLREELGNARFEVITSQGRVMTTEQAIALALEPAEEM